MTKVYIIHGWGHSSNMPWIKWLEEELGKKHGFEIFPLDMPNSSHPKIEEWVSYLKENVKEIGEKTYFVGHSIGCQTILRFLEKEPKSEHIKGCFFVAPWLELMGLNDAEMTIAHPWTSSKINPERVAQHTGNITCLFSEDDPYVSKEEIEKFKERFGAKILMRKHERHFEESKELRELLEFLK